MKAREHGRLDSGATAKQAQGIDITPEEIPGRAHALILHLAGYIDSYNAGHFRREVERLISLGYVDLFFDLEGVSYVSSLGMATFIDFRKGARLLHGDIFLSGVQPRVYEIFKLLGFATYFSFTGSVQEALEHLSSPARGPVFPSIQGCPICGRRLKLTREGRFRCPECKTVLLVDKSADIAVA